MEERGQQWVSIAQNFPGKTPEDLKKKFTDIQQQRKKMRMQESASSQAKLPDFFSSSVKRSPSFEAPFKSVMSTKPVISGGGRKRYVSVVCVDYYYVLTIVYSLLPTMHTHTLYVKTHLLLFNLVYHPS